MGDRQGSWPMHFRSGASLRLLARLPVVVMRQQTPLSSCGNTNVHPWDAGRTASRDKRSNVAQRMAFFRHEWRIHLFF